MLMTRQGGMCRLSREQDWYKVVSYARAGTTATGVESEDQYS